MPTPGSEDPGLHQRGRRSPDVAAGLQTRGDPLMEGAPSAPLPAPGWGQTLNFNIVRRPGIIGAFVIRRGRNDEKR